jgi:pimeloyl-ACP methyl ester carboxylesterase
MLFINERLTLMTLRARGFVPRWVATSVGRMRVWVAPGKGTLPSLVLLHGLASAAVHLEPMFDQLRAHTRAVIVPDLPGHGESDVPADGLTPASLQQGLLETLDSLAIRNATVFGNSLGGAAAVRYALARPEQVGALILVSPAGALMSAENFVSFTESLRNENHEKARGFVDRVFVKTPWPRALMAWGTVQKFAASPVQSLLTTSQPADQITASQLRALTVPTLLVWPQGDKVFPAGCKEFFATHLPNCELAEPEGLGHSPYLENARYMSDAVLRWMSAQFAARAARESEAQPTL